MKIINLVILGMIISFSGCAYTPSVFVNNEANDYILMNKINLPKGYAIQSFHSIFDEEGIYSHDIYKGKCSDNVLAYNHYFGNKEDGYISSFYKSDVGFCIETDETGKSFLFISEETAERVSYRHIVETIEKSVEEANFQISENKFFIK